MTAVLPQNGSLAKAVKVADLRAYLLSRGWQIKPFRRPQVIFFEGPPDDSGHPIVQLVPSSEQLSDYSLRVEEIISTLSAIENRPEAEVFRSIVSPTCDILRLRLESDETRSGTLNFGFVDQFFASMRNLLVFAACSEIRPQPFYQRALKQAIAFADRCRMRPAPIGSFVVDIESPLVPPVNASQRARQSFPTERLFVLTLMRALDDLHSSIEGGDTDAVIRDSDRRVNANLCDALLGMKPESSDVRLEASVSWSPAWPIVEDAPRSRVTFERRAFEQIDAIGHALRVGDEPQRRELVGKVVRLSGEDPVNGQVGTLNITLRAEGKNTPSNVDLALTPERYRQACDAHRDGKKLSVTGVLDRVERRKWMLLEISDFKVIP